MKKITQAKSKSNVWKITLINIRITFSSENYRKSLKTLIYENFKINEWNLQTIIHIFPFLFGFYKMIFDRYKDQTFSSFFEKSLPANSILTETISWETFEYIKSKDLNYNKIKKIDIFNNSILLTFEENNEHSFVGFFSPNQNLETKKRDSKYYQIFLEQVNDFFISNPSPKKLFFNELYYNLDELPSKLENFSNTPSKKESFFESEIKSLEKKSPQFFEQTKKQKKTTQNINFQAKIISISQSSSAQTNNKFLSVKAFSKYSSDTNRTIQPEVIKTNSERILKEVDLNTKNAIQRELYFLFLKNDLPSNFDFDRIKSSKFNNKLLFSNFPFNSYSAKETLKLTNEFLSITPNSLLTRKISGFSFPDVSNKELYSLRLNFLLRSSTKNIALKINLPASFISFSEDHTYWSTLVKKLCINQRKDGFFGRNLQKLVPEKSKKINESKIKTGLLKEVNKKETRRVKKFNHSDPDSWFLVFNADDTTKRINFELDNLTSFLEKKDHNNYFFCNLGQKQIKKDQITYHFSKFSENLVNENFCIQSNTGETYKRVPSLSSFTNYNQTNSEKSTFTFFESWEPISFNSWMIIMQFSVGLFLLQLLKDLYKDYGKELVDYVLHFASSSGIDVEEIKEQYLYDDPGYRIIKKVKKKFADIAGIDTILPELGEIVWFLRNSGRSSKFKNTIPKGILLTGPPGTGKTLLVQAIAGEAQVPVIVESGSLLSDPQQKGRGIEKLKKIFDQARQIAPCIIFIDEVDTIGEKRQNIIQTAMGGDEIIESLYSNKENELETNFIRQPLNLDEQNTTQKDLEYELYRGTTENQSNLGLGQFQQNMEAKKTRLSLLTQFLVEMDGLKDRKGVIVIGATNRPTVLDPALIRPGRFDKILNLELPGKKKRIEILKFYSKKLKIEKEISWDYLANRTKGFSAADLAAAMNESAIQSILQETTHTIETIERGIELVTSYSFEKNIFQQKENSNDPFFLSRLAYYQSGKGILQSILSNHEPVVVLHLWPRQKNARHARFYERSFLKMKTRVELEAELIVLYGGKAGELFTLYATKNQKSLKRWHSDFGIEDGLAATFLANLMIDKWFLFSNKLVSRKSNQLTSNRNSKEFKEVEKIEIINSVENQIEDEIQIEQIAKLFRSTGYQQRGFGPWWQIQVSKQTSEIESFFADWYRIYLPDPEESILNLEWIPPDEFYHTNESLKKVYEKSDPSFNDLYKIERDYIYHGLILNSFNTAFSSLENLREFLDYFADYLLRFSILREDQISFIFREEKSQEKQNFTKLNNQLGKNYKIIEKTWGKNSRRRTFRFINFQTLNSLQTENNSSWTFFNL